LCVGLQAVEFLALELLAHWSGAQLLKTASAEAISLVRETHLLVQRQSSARDVLECVLFGSVKRHVVVAAHACVDELNVDFLTDALQVAITPILKRVG